MFLLIITLFFTFTTLHVPCSTLFPYTTLFRSRPATAPPAAPRRRPGRATPSSRATAPAPVAGERTVRSEEHTSELQSRFDLVCRLLLEKKNWIIITPI